MAFAVMYSDMHFDGVRTPEESVDRIQSTKRAAQEAGRNVQAWTSVGVICRPTRAEASDYLNYVVDHADMGSIGHLAEMHARDAKDHTDDEGIHRRNGEGPIERRVLARGSYCTVGDPDWVAEEFVRLSNVGFDGLVLNFVDYLEELPYFVQEVLPRLERAGVRGKVALEQA